MQAGEGAQRQTPDLRPFGSSWGSSAPHRLGILVQLFRGWKDPWAMRAAKGGNDVRMEWLARPIEHAATASKLVRNQHL